MAVVTRYTLRAAGAFASLGLVFRRLWPTPAPTLEPFTAHPGLLPNDVVPALPVSETCLILSFLVIQILHSSGRDTSGT